MEIVLPKQVQDISYRFIPVAKRGKESILKDWPNQCMQFDNQSFQKHIASGGNYGVVTGHGNLAVLDLDTAEAIEKIEPKLPATFVVNTKKGRHYYFKIKDKNELTKIILLNKTDKSHQGELIPDKKHYVVGANSVHKSGIAYAPNDLQIAEIDSGFLLGILKDYELKSSPSTPKEAFALYEPDSCRLHFKELADFSTLHKHSSEEYVGPHPFHESTTGTNFCANPAKGVWYCFRHEYGGGAIQLLAIKEKISECGEALSGDKFAVAQQKYWMLVKAIELPGTGRLVSEFASDLGNKFMEKTILFRRDWGRGHVLIVEKINAKANGTEQSWGFRELSPEEFVTFIETIVTPVRRGEKGKYKERSLEINDARKVLVCRQFLDKLPKIAEIYNAQMPILKGDKLILPKKGYDLEFCSWLSEDAPTIEQDISLEEAKKIIDEMLGEFRFKESQDKTNAVAALLTPMCRGIYKEWTTRTPIVIYSANQPGLGKDYLAGIIAIVYSGIAAEETPLVDGNIVHGEEFRKKILAKAIAGQTRYHSANNRGHLDCASLEQANTNHQITDRKLGTTNDVSYPNIIEFSLSANIGLTYTKDFARRSIIINLFSAEENVNKHRFKNPDLHGWVKNNRPKILGALYSMIKNWYDIGMPSGKTPFASFPEWERVVGGIMESAGLDSPCIVSSNDDSYGDVETRDMKRFFDYCYETWSDSWVEWRDVIEVLYGENVDYRISDLFSDLPRTDINSFKIKMGKLLSKYIGRKQAGILFEVDSLNTEGRKRKCRFVMKGEED